MAAQSPTKPLGNIIHFEAVMAHNGAAPSDRWRSLPKTLSFMAAWKCAVSLTARSPKTALHRPACASVIE
jgi:hypothetical protein